MASQLFLVGAELVLLTLDAVSLAFELVQVGRLLQLLLELEVGLLQFLGLLEQLRVLVLELFESCAELVDLELVLASLVTDDLLVPSRDRSLVVLPLLGEFPDSEFERLFSLVEFLDDNDIFSELCLEVLVVGLLLLSESEKIILEGSLFVSELFQFLFQAFFSSLEFFHLTSGEF